MKKYTIIFAIIHLFIIACNAQERSGDTWVLGLLGKLNILKWKTKDSIEATYIPKNKITIVFDEPNSSICDQHGNLKFYSSSCAIAGNDFKIVTNGKDINAGPVFDEYCEDSYATYPANNNAVFLPKPEDSTQYYFFHMARINQYFGNTLYPFYRFYYSVIDDSKPKAEVIKKNILLVQDSLSCMGPVACRHANGRDWWVLIPTIAEHSFYRALLTKDSIVFVGHQILGSKFGRSLDDYYGQSAFSADGSKYVRSDFANGTYIYDFDRCTGLMSNPVFIDTLIASGCAGVCFSPNSRYLYIANRVVLHQFDLWADNIFESRVKVGVYDGTITDIGTVNSFYKMALAPDDKIYMGATNTTESLHVIHNPNAKGDSCNFKQHDYKLPYYFYRGFPNYPNFRLGPKDGVICPPNVATAELEKPLFAAKVFPNPAKDKVVLAWETYLEQNASWELYNQYGQLVLNKRLELSTQEATIDISNIENGIYFWKLNLKNKIGQTGKLVVMK